MMTEYGNVPPDDVDAIRTAVAIANRVAAALPPIVPAEWRDTTYEWVLDGILGDWVANGTTDLEQEDEDDLANLARLAADTAMEQPENRRDSTFRVVLGNVMSDWVENWNAGEDDEDEEEELEEDYRGL
jgi:hypothetical protein